MARTHRTVSRAARQARRWTVPFAVIAMLMGLLAPLAPASAQEGGTVTVMSHLCPDDWGDQGIGPRELDRICDERVDAPAFITISADGFETSDKVAGGMSMFQGVPYGTLQITHTEPRGFGDPAVFCDDTFEGAGADDQLDVEDGATVTWEHDPAAEVGTRCHFYFMPAGDEGAALAPSSDVTLAAWSCPPGTDVRVTTIGTCEVATADTAFALAGGELDLAWTVDVAEDDGSILDLAPASYTIDATPPDAGAAIHWRCGAPGVDIVQAPLVAGATAELATEAGGDYRCDWFVVAAEGDPGEQPESIANVVRVAGIACPVGVDPASGFATLAGQCPAPVVDRPDIVFEITDPGGSFWSKGSTLDESGFEAFEFTEAPVGQMRLEQQPLEGYAGSVAWCSDTGAGDLGTGEPASTDGAVTWLRRPDATEALTCVFFNFTDPGAATPAASPQATPVSEVDSGSADSISG